MKLDTTKYEILTGVQTVDNYPWGFTLKTEQRYWIEFKKNKGFRAMTQTKNPKNGAWCKPKASTYSHFMFMYKDVETGYIQFYRIDIYGVENLAKFIDLLKANNFEFTEEQNNEILAQIRSTIVGEYKYKRTPEAKAEFLNLLSFEEIKSMVDVMDLKNINIDIQAIEDLEKIY